MSTGWSWMSCSAPSMRSGGTCRRSRAGPGRVALRPARMRAATARRPTRRRLPKATTRPPTGRRIRSPMDNEAYTAASESLALGVRDAVQAAGGRLVTVESCTAGRIAATLAEIPGASQWLCGGIAVYRSASKHEWLGVPWELIQSAEAGPVSLAMSRFLANAALVRTPEATVALGITGDLGPGAPPRTDGRVFMAVADRNSVREAELQLRSPSPRDAADIPGRRRRLDEATQAGLRFLLDVLRGTPSA
ncbi:MAG: CinA family protein [Planctomycetota bacterium]|nr:MAG: CinA family protein [Planctomycetota bacterium]